MDILSYAARTPSVQALFGEIPAASLTSKRFPEHTYRHTYRRGNEIRMIILVARMMEMLGRHFSDFWEFHFLPAPEARMTPG